MGAKQREELLAHYHQYLKACYANFENLLKTDGMEWNTVTVSLAIASGESLMEVMKQEAMDSVRNAEVLVDLGTRFGLIGFSILSAIAQRDMRIVDEIRGDDGKAQTDGVTAEYSDIVEERETASEVGPQVVPGKNEGSSERTEDSGSDSSEESPGLGEVPGVSNAKAEEEDLPNDG